MRVLVTGHAGYLGTVLLEQLKRDDHSVDGVDAAFYGDCRIAGVAPSGEESRDIRDLVPDDFVGFEAVVHLAGLSNDVLGQMDPALTFEINHLAAAQVARYARDAGVGRFVLMSSCSVYGTHKQLLDEDSPVGPQTAYAISKLRAEADIIQLADDGFAPTALRASTVYGLSPAFRSDIVVNTMVARAAAQHRIVVSSGASWRPLVHVTDVASAVRVVLTAPIDDVRGETFNLGAAGENYRIRDLARMVAEVVDGTEIVDLPDDGAPDGRSYRVDVGKFAARFPSYKPRWNVDRGIRQLHECLAALAARVTEPVDPLDPRFVRIEELRRHQREGTLDGALRHVPAGGERR